MNDGLVKLVDWRFVLAWSLLCVPPGQNGMLVCDHTDEAAELFLCVRCAKWLQCADCYREHRGPAHEEQRCDVCAGPTLIRVDEPPFVTVNLPEPLLVVAATSNRYGWWQLPVGICRVGSTCGSDACGRRLAEAALAASELPPLEGREDIRSAQLQYAGLLFAVLAA